VHNIWFTADLHLGHTNIIKHCDRPYYSIKDMDDSIIQNWNSVVSRKDTVYIVGDFIWKASLKGYYLHQLNGKKILIKGNHDRLGTNFYKTGLTDVKDYKVVKFNGFRFVLFHYPIENWDGKAHGYIHLHGHSHGKTKIVNNRIDVGVDCNGYTPVHVDDILKTHKAWS